MREKELNKGGALSALLKRREMSLVLILLVMGIILTFSSSSFLTSDNLFNILKQTTLVAIISIGQTFAIISGGIDLCVGQTMTFGSIMLAYALKAGWNVFLAMLICVIASTFVGLINGLLITRLKLPPFIITLGMTNIVKGVILVLTEGNIVLLDNEFIGEIGRGSLGPVPYMVIVLVILAIAFIFVLTETVYGNRVKAIGGNETAAGLSGISVKSVRTMVYVITGVLCGIAGIIVTGRLNGGNPNAYGTYDMDSIAAVIVGGTSLSGGVGSIVGSLLGALIMIVIKNGLVLLHVNVYWQTVAIGLVIIAVCAIDSFTNARKQK